jgi:hypothetical protein
MSGPGRGDDYVLQLDVATVDRVLGGRLAVDDPPVLFDVVDLLSALSAPNGDAGAPEAEFVRQMSRAVRSAPVRTVPPGQRRRRAAVVASFVAGTAAGVSGLAAANVLPDSVQHVTAIVLEKVGVEVPDPHEARAASRGRRAEPGGRPATPPGRDGEQPGNRPETPAGLVDNENANLGEGNPQTVGGQPEIPPGQETTPLEGGAPSAESTGGGDTGATGGTTSEEPAAEPTTSDTPEATPGRPDTPPGRHSQQHGQRPEEPPGQENAAANGKEEKPKK